MVDAHLWALAVLAGLCLALVATRPWPVGLLQGVGGAGVALPLVAMALSLRAPGWWRPWARRTVVGLGLVALAAASTAWRIHQRSAALWPVDLAAGRARAHLMIDGLPQALPKGGWLVEARVLAWASVQGQTDRDGSASDHVRHARQVSRRAWGDAPVPEPGMRRLAAIERVRVVWPAGLMPEPGSTWWATGRWDRPDGAVNPAGWDAALLAWERGIGAVGQIAPDGLPAGLQPDARPAAHDAVALWSRWRAHLRERIQAHVPATQSASVIAGLTIGDQSAIDTRDWDVFRATGVAHLVSISGSHIAVVGWWVAWLVRRAWGRVPHLAHRWPAPEAARVMACLACTGYAWLAGWGVPAQRTVWSMWALTALRLGGRDWPWMLAMLWVMAVVALIDPWALLQPGFWLSFLCVAVLMTVGDEQAQPLLSSAPTDATVRSAAVRMGHAVRQATWPLVRVQLLLSVAMAPLALLCFHQVSLAGMLVNLVAIPVCDLALTPLALMGLVVPALWSLADVILRWGLVGLQHAAAWPVAVWSAPQMPTGLGVAMVGSGLLWAWPGPRGWRWGWAWMLWPALCLPPSWRLLPTPAPGQFLAVAIDVGQGSSVLVQTHAHALLFDTGPVLGEQDDAGRRHILPLLQAMGVRRLDLLALSHEDADHVGGARSVLDGLTVAGLWSSLPPDHPVRTWHAGARGDPLPHVACVAGQSWVWDGVRFEGLHPLVVDPDSPPNAHSCVLRVQAAATAHGMAGEPSSLLLPGDIEAPQEAAVLDVKSSALRSTVLVAPHHGSSTSSTEAFLQAVQPQQVVIQAGRHNRYGHPSPGVIARYDQLGLPWVASPGCGAWWWSSDEPPRASASAEARAARVGHCWRHDHPHHWDGGRSTE